MVDFTALQTTLLTDLSSELPAALRLQRLVVGVRDAFACSAVVLLRLDGDSLRPQAATGLVHEVLGRVPDRRRRRAPRDSRRQSRGPHLKVCSLNLGLLDKTGTSVTRRPQRASPQICSLLVISR